MHTCAIVDICDNAKTLRHAGPRQEAIDVFHGSIGPQWPVVFDGVAGHFTVRDESVGVEFVATLAAAA